MLVDEVHDQLQFVQALEIGDFGLIAGVHQSLEPGADKLAHAAAKDGLLAEQVGLGLFLEGGLDDARTQRADALKRRPELCPGLCRWRPGRRRRSAGTPPPSVYTRRTKWPGPLGATIVTSTFGRRDDLVEVDVEAVGEHEHVALFEVVADGGLVNHFLGLVGDDHHDDVGATAAARPRS